MIPTIHMPLGYIPSTIGLTSQFRYLEHGKVAHITDGLPAAVAKRVYLKHSVLNQMQQEKQENAEKESYRKLFRSFMITLHGLIHCQVR
mmetsp:Transcript_118302/g.232258  ORF Transcript_118302/g.232258 Transcript_118302/m.232258 type:complete len:89 (-) Transcript_118302:2931-3197(-)